MNCAAEPKRDKEKEKDRKIITIGSHSESVKQRAQRPYPKKKPGEEGLKEKVYWKGEREESNNMLPSKKQQ